MRCMKRRLLLETFEQELPEGTIRFGSRVVSFEQSKNFQLVHLADGSLLKTKVNLTFFLTTISYLIIVLKSKMDNDREIWEILIRF